MNYFCLSHDIKSIITKKNMIMNRLLALCLSPDQGGLELYILKLTKHYSHDKNFFIACSEKSYISENTHENKVECKSGGIFKIIRNFLILRKFILTHQINLIHVSWAKDLILAVFLKILIPINIKIIFYRQMKLTRPKKNFYHKFLYRNIDLFLVITKKLYMESCEFLPLDKSKIHILPYGIDKPVIKPSISKEGFFRKYKMDLSKFSIGVFSRIEEQKGQHIVIDAIKHSEHDIQLFIIGHCMNDKYKSELISRAKKYNLSSKLCFVGFLKSPMSYMPYFDLIILPTYEETFGLTVVEAMLMSVPVIGSNAGGVPEIISHKHNGLLFKTRDHNDLMQNIDSLIANKELRKKIIENGVKSSNKDYDYQKHFENLEKLMNIVLPS